MTIKNNTIQISRRFAHQEVSMGAILSSDAARLRPASANAVPSDKMVFRWAMDDAPLSHANLTKSWWKNDGLTSTVTRDTTRFRTGSAGIRIQKTVDGEEPFFAYDDRVYNLFSKGGPTSCTYDGSLNVEDVSVAADWGDGGPKPVIDADVIGINISGNEWGLWGHVQSIAGANMTLTADIGDAVADIDSHVFRPLFTLPDWHCQLHLRFRINEVNVVSDNTAIRPYLSIGPNQTYRLPDGDRKMQYSNSPPGQRWIGTSSLDVSDGWIEVTWNLYSDYTLKGSEVDLSETDISITGMGVALQGTSAPAQADITFDEMWITRSRPLIHQTTDAASDPPVQTPVRKGAITIQLDDTLAGVTSADDGKNTLELAALLEERGMRGSFPVMVRVIGQVVFDVTDYFVADWDTLARLSEMGHELIMHDTTGPSAFTAVQAEDRIKEILDIWYTEAPRRGIQNYQAGARFWLSPGNQMPVTAMKVWEQYFLNWMGQARYGAIWTAGAPHGGEDDNLTYPWHNMWPRVTGSMQRLNFSSGWNESGNNDETKIVGSAADADTMGGLLILYGHRCSTGDDIEGIPLETVSNWTTVLDAIDAAAYRVVTLSEFYDNILPTEATWRV